MANKEWRFKPLKAAECSFEELKYPCWATPKIDGINGLNLNGKSLGRSLKPYANVWLNGMLELWLPEGLCYEVTIGDFPYGEDLCRNTTSFVNAIKKEHEKIIVNVFDFIGDASEGYIKDRNYLARIDDAMDELYTNFPASLWQEYEVGTGEAVDRGWYFIVNDFLEIRVMEPVEIQNKEEAEWYYNSCLDHEYEGAMFRQDIPYKCGRATAKSQEVVRFKPSHDTEAVVVGFEEAMENLNEAKINELGHTERSSHKENKRPLGMLGAFLAIDIKTGDLIKIGAGKLSHAERIEIWENQNQFLYCIAKYRSMSTGIKDKPRFPRFITWRSIDDLAEEDVAAYKKVIKSIELKLATGEPLC